MPNATTDVELLQLILELRLAAHEGPTITNRVHAPAKTRLTPELAIRAAETLSKVVHQGAVNANVVPVAAPMLMHRAPVLRRSH